MPSERETENRSKFSVNVTGTKNDTLLERIKEFNGDRQNIENALRGLPGNFIEPYNIGLSARNNGFKKIEICPTSINDAVSGIFITPKYIDINHPIIVSNSKDFTRFFNKRGEVIVIYYQRISRKEDARISNHYR